MQDRYAPCAANYKATSDLLGTSITYRSFHTYSVKPPNNVTGGAADAAAARAWSPGPTHEAVLRNMTGQRVNIAVIVSPWIFDLGADFRKRFALPVRRSRRQVPVRMTRNTGGIEVPFTMAGSANACRLRPSVSIARHKWSV